MATKKARKPREKKERNKSFRGGRKAESLSRQIERLKDKFPLAKDSAGEWLHYARVMKTTAEVLEVQALSELDPGRFRGLKEAVVSRAKAKAEARGTDAEEAEEEAEGSRLPAPSLLRTLRGGNLTVAI